RAPHPTHGSHRRSRCGPVAAARFRVERARAKGAPLVLRRLLLIGDLPNPAQTSNSLAWLVPRWPGVTRQHSSGRYTPDTWPRPHAIGRIGHSERKNRREG